MPDDLTWRDPDSSRTVLLREGLVADAPAALAGEGWDEFELFTTERAIADAPALREAAAATHLVPGGQVPGLAAGLLDDVGSSDLVACGGGRVIDVAKAIAAVRGSDVAAIPTTLSGAEMTVIHRLPEGADEGTARVRPALVLADPVAMTSAPEDLLRASSMNALAHGADCLYTPAADDLSRGPALKGAGLIAAALDQSPSERDRSELAMGSLLCAHALDRAGLALHHVLSQSSVRVFETPHAETNAALLPVVMEELRARAPEQMRALAEAVGTRPEGLKRRLEELGGGRRGLGGLGAERAKMPAVVAAALAREEHLARTPGPKIGAADLERLLQAAW